MATVSILLLTINRFNLTREYVGNALRDAGHEFELCITDNGSTDPMILKWNEEQNPKIYNRNEKNEGTAQSLNRMIEQNPSDYYCFIGNDIKLPPGWLKSLVEVAMAVPNPGVIGIDWRHANYQTHEFNGVKVWENPTVFGTMFISQSTREKVGKFCEDYGPYGLWDSDYSIRTKKAGLFNCYLHGVHSHHFGNDVGNQDAYRKMKDESLKNARPKFDENCKKYEKGEIYIG